jgi:UDP-2,3-diacylglucosamine hydrolase
MDTAPPVPAELRAPAHWQAVDFISDLHLQAIEPATVAAWRSYMRDTPAQAIFILGDLFEVWIGDDAAEAGTFEAGCADVLRDAATRHDVFFMHGNRDFLLGPAFAARCGMTLLADPTTLVFGGKRWLLSHGDALCLDDHAYMAFRAQVRTPEWQAAFLARPLAERHAFARGLRAQSEARKSTGVVYPDVDAPHASQWLAAAQASVLIHGHTHRPATHALPGGGRRTVLSDWDAAASPPRLQLVRLTADGLQRLALPPP